MLPHDATATEFAQDLDDGVRSRPQRRHVAKTDDLVHTGSADLREHGAQCLPVRKIGAVRRKLTCAERLVAGGRRIRTAGPSRETSRSFRRNGRYRKGEKTVWKSSFILRGTEGSNLLPSADESS